MEVARFESRWWHASCADASRVAVCGGTCVAVWEGGEWTLHEEPGARLGSLAAGDGFLLAAGSDGLLLRRD